MEQEKGSDKSMSGELKPCPFCGTIPVIEKRLLCDGTKVNPPCYEYDIHCINHNCGCSIYLERNYTINRSDEEAKANAIKAWNTRADDKNS